MAAPMPKSDSERMIRLLSICVWICVPFTVGVAMYNVCGSQFEGRKDSFLLDEIFLAFIE